MCILVPLVKTLPFCHLVVGSRPSVNVAWIIYMLGEGLRAHLPYIRSIRGARGEGGLLGIRLILAVREGNHVVERSYFHRPH